MENERVQKPDDAALGWDFVFLCCFSWSGEHWASVDGWEEEEAGSFTLADDEGLVCDLLGPDEFLGFFGDAEVVLEEPLAYPDNEEEDELL